MRIVTDQGTAFTSRRMEDFMLDNGEAHIRVSTQHPQSNGLCERMNKEVARLLRTLSEKEDKSDRAAKSPEVQSWINRTVACGTGKAPLEALYGYLPRLDNFSRVVEGLQHSVWKPTEEIREEIRKTIEDTQAEYAQNYDKKRRPHVRFNIGDVVMVERLPVHTGDPTKLQKKFRGPLVVVEMLPKDAYRLVQLGKDKGYTCTAHCSQTRWYKPHADEVDDIVPLTGEKLEFAGQEVETESQAQDVTMRSILEEPNIDDISMQDSIGSRIRQKVETRRGILTLHSWRRRRRRGDSQRRRTKRKTKMTSRRNRPRERIQREARDLKANIRKN